MSITSRKPAQIAARVTVVWIISAKIVVDNEELYEEVCRHIQCEAKARSFRLNSSSISLSHPLVKRAVEMGLKPFGSPTLSDQALMHFPSLKMGPGKSSRSHTADEYIRIDEIEDAIKMYLELLDGAEL